jgi:hypothetical protein
MKKCLSCDKEILQIEGKKSRQFCNDACRMAYKRKAKSEQGNPNKSNPNTEKIKSEQGNPNNKQIISDKPNINKIDQKEYRCKSCGKILNEEYGNLAYLVDKCYSCCKSKAPNPKQDQKDYKVLKEKGSHGEDMFYCSEHREHCKKYCDAMCNENCIHVLA